MLQAAIEQYEERYPEREVKVMKDAQWYVRFTTTLRETLPDPSLTTTEDAHDETAADSADASDATPARGKDGRPSRESGSTMLIMVAVCYHTNRIFIAPMCACT